MLRSQRCTEHAQSKLSSPPHLKESFHGSDSNQEPDIDVCSNGSQQGEDRSHDDANTEDPAPANLLGQQTSRNLSDDVAIEECTQNLA